MPLIKCSDCQKEISDSANWCVFCGYRKQQSIFSQDLGFDGKVFTTIMVFGIIAFFIGGLISGSGGSVPMGLGLIVLGLVMIFVSTLLRLIRSLK